MTRPSDRYVKKAEECIERGSEPGAGADNWFRAAALWLRLAEHAEAYGRNCSCEPDGQHVCE